MKIHQILTIIALLCLGSAVHVGAQQNTDELKQRILAQAQSMSADDYAFTRTIRSETNSKGKTEKKVLIEKFDPTKPADARWTLVSINGAPPTAEQLKSHAKEAA
jgi:outer membrane lipoprotein-sorting protein